MEGHLSEQKEVAGFKSRIRDGSGEQGSVAFNFNFICAILFFILRIHYYRELGICLEKEKNN